MAVKQHFKVTNPVTKALKSPQAAAKSGAGTDDEDDEEAKKKALKAKSTAIGVLGGAAAGLANYYGSGG